MSDYISLIVLFLLVFFLAPILQRFFSFLPQNLGATNLPYHSKYILTGSEYKFYVALRPMMCAQSYIICPKVGMKDLFEVNAGTKDRMKYFRNISQKHIDFLVCDENLHPLFAIELDDKSHKRSEVTERDQFKDAVFKSAGLPLYRVPTSTSYSEEYLKRYIPIS